MGKRAKAKPGAKAEVETYKHKEAKRKNIPTAENQKLIADDDKAIKKLRWPRNPDLDPQLVWRGKDIEPDALEVDAPPIYIQEKIKPQAIIEDLRRQTKERNKDAASQFDFFHDFNGLPEGWKEDATASYYHDEGNWSNRMILGDSLLVMTSLAEREGLRGKVQCIYMDPPYGIRFNSNWQPFVRVSDVRDSSANSVSREPEVIRAFRDTWRDGINSYLTYLRDRLVVARDLLSASGSIFVQIGLENLGLVRSLLDEVFNSANLISIVSFTTTSGFEASFISNRANYLIWYAKDIEAARHKFRRIYKEKQTVLGEGNARWIRQKDGIYRGVKAREKRGEEPIPKGAILYKPDNILSQGPASEPQVFEFRGKSYDPAKNNSHWKASFPIGMERLARADRIHVARNSIQYVRLNDDFGFDDFGNVWTDTQTGNFTRQKVFVVQTAEKVVERCLLMTTDPGDLVLDPTCGSGTTAYVAEQWGRRWITIDTSRVALTIARAELMGARFEYYLLDDSKEGADKQAELIGKPVASGPFARNLRQGFVYARASHIMLESIANNAEIDVIWDRWQKTLQPLRENLNKALKENWTECQIPHEVGDKWTDAVKQLHAQWWEASRARQKEIDDSIARNADVEYLYDRPYKAPGVVRVAGPFTVESLSPHRVRGLSAPSRPRLTKQPGQN